MKFRNVLVFIFGMFLSGNLNAQIDFREIVLEEEWNQAIVDARASDKLIFLDIYATWCGPCKYLDRNVYTDLALGEYYNANFINVKMDGETAFGSMLARKFQLGAYPTMFYLSADEKIITRLVGVREAGPLNEIGKTLSQNHKRLEVLSGNYEMDNLNAMELKEFQDLLSRIEQNDLADQVAAKILPSLGEDAILDPQNKSLIVNSAIDLDSKVYQVVRDNPEKIDTIWSIQEKDQFYASVFNTTLFRAIENRDEVLLSRIIEEFLPDYMGEGSGDLEQGEFITKKLYFANTGEWARYNDHIMAIYRSRFEGDDKFLYMEAYEVANEYNQNPEAIDLATGWMKQATEINPSFDNLVMVSYLLIIDGDMTGANTYIEQIKAMEINEDQQKVLEEILKLVSAPRNG